jgi:hypothetical protein
MGHRPLGVAISAILLHILNLLTFMFIRWNEPDTLVLAALFILYICFTAIVIHAYWMGQSWARWLILIRSVWMLVSIKMLAVEGGIYRGQGVVERVLAIILLVYLNMPSVRGWFASARNNHS